MPQVDVNLVIALVGTIFGAGIVWGIMKGKVSTHGVELTALKNRIIKHEEAAMPHLLCPAHEASMQAILTGLNDIKVNLKTVSDQIFVLSQQRLGD
jgi:formiminotetrahydrofolate cyclodeaminase